MTAPNATYLKARWIAARDQTEAASMAYVRAVSDAYVPAGEVTALLDEWMVAQIRMARAHLEYLTADLQEGGAA